MSSTPSNETTYFQEGNITITNARAVLGEKTYAMSNVTSVSMGTIPPNRSTPIIIGLVGFALGGCGLASETRSWALIIIGLVAVAVAALIFFTAKERYIVKIGSASGEANALSSIRRDYIEKIVKAMNDAIIRRG